MTQCTNNRPVAALHGVFAHLRKSPASRSLLYLGGAVAIVDAVAALSTALERHAPIFDRTTPTGAMLFRLTQLALGSGWTALVVQLEDKPMRRVPLAHAVKEIAAGGGMGAAAFMLFAAYAAKRGWVSAPVWGWEQWSPHALAESITVQGITHGAIAVSEEMVFRGYGLETLSEAIGAPLASAVMVALFACYHERSPLVLFSTGTAGVLLTTLRLTSGSVQLPIGYHMGWNVAQTAILGPADGPPSIRPLHVDVPNIWVGRPGYPQPGLISAFINLGIADVIGVAWWLHARRRA